jgi:parallel beta-helix repeat protein
VIDYLPRQLDYISSNPVADYNSTYRTVKWNLPNFNGSSSGTVHITTMVNTRNVPCGKITNTACLESDKYCSVALRDVNVCNWTNIIYANEHVTGGDGTGTSWENAYKNLQMALGGAQLMSCGSQIWVAAGNYKPTDIPDNSQASFNLVQGANLYGHFAGDENSLNERNLADADNETVLDGLIDPEYDGRVNNIITGQSIHNSTIVDGLTIQKAEYGGVSLGDCNAIISNCKIRDNNSSYDNSFGLYLQYCPRCIVKNNIISDNGGHGIYCFNDNNDTIINNFIYNNGTLQNQLSGDGIYIAAAQKVSIRNNTIFSNFANGIYVTQTSQHPNVKNCIIRGNAKDFSDGNAFSVNYCCLKNSHSGTGNFVAAPCFVNPNSPYDLHIKWNSPCTVTGDANGIPSNETDIDGEPRTWYGRVDIGADEYYRSPDFDANGIVNFNDLAVLALAWFSTPASANWNPRCDFAQNRKIDAGDLKLFCQNWLWHSGVIKTQDSNDGGDGGGDGGEEPMEEESMGSGLMLNSLMRTTAISMQSDVAENDVEAVLEWTDAIELEAEMAGLPAADYAAFRQALERDLLGTLEPATDDQ